MYYYGGGLLDLILVVFCLYLILTDRNSDANKVLWVLIVLILPLLGPILYLLIGRGAARV